MSLYLDGLSVNRRRGRYHALSLDAVLCRKGTMGLRLMRLFVLLVMLTVMKVKT